MKDDKKKYRRNKGIFIAAAIHVAVIFLCFILGFEVIDPKTDTVIDWEIEGIENAGGDNQKTPTAETPSNKPTEESTSASSQAVDEQEIINDASSEVAVKSTPVTSKTKSKTVSTEKKPKEAEKEKEPENKISDALAKAREAYKKGIDNPGGEGPEKDPGIKGNPDTDGTNPDGGKGGGGKYDISGRKATDVGSQKNGCGKSGTVVVKITVNRAGVVINAVAVGGTSTNSCLQNQAIQFAKRIQYAPKSSGPKTNEGKITIKYKIS